MNEEPETHVQMKFVALRQQLIAHSKDDTMLEDSKTPLQTEMAGYRQQLQQQFAELRQQLLADIRAELEEFREKLLTELTEEFVLTRAKKVHSPKPDKGTSWLDKKLF